MEDSLWKAACLLLLASLLQQTSYVDGRPTDNAQSNSNNGDGGYNYPIPENPLEFPSHTTARITTQVHKYISIYRKYSIDIGH